MPSPSLDQLIQETRSDEPLVRSLALQQLLAQVRQEPAVHARVLPVFREACRGERDARGRVSAVEGIAHIVGGAEARSAWLSVLGDPDPLVVVMATAALADASYGAVLLELVARRPELAVRNAALAALGRLQCAEALPVLLESLGPEETRWDAIEALTNLGDPRALPHLEPLLNDQSALRRPDERGWPLDVRDITGYAISRLQYLAKTGPQPRFGPTGEDARTRASSVQRPFNPLACLPLLAAVLEVPWLMIVGTPLRDPSRLPTLAGQVAATRQAALQAALPVAAGLLIGLGMLLRGTARRWPERICLYLGTALCGTFLWALTREFLAR